MKNNHWKWILATTAGVLSIWCLGLNSSRLSRFNKVFYVKDQKIGEYSYKYINRLRQELYRRKIKRKGEKQF